MEEENKVEVAKVVEEEKTGGGFAVASLVCSLVGIIFFGIIMGILGIIFGMLGLGSKRSGLATAGLIIGIVDVVIVLFGLAIL
jgi:hypothetical protein